MNTNYEYRWVFRSNNKYFTGRETVSFDTVLDELDKWDSIVAISTIAFFNKNFGLKITAADVLAFETVEYIAQKAGI